MHLTALDFIVLAGYFMGLIAMGVYFSRRQTSQASYYLGDRKMPWFLVGISVVATLVSTNTYLATPGEMIKNGIGFFSMNLAYVFVIPAVTLIIIPVLMRLPVTSVYEYLDKRFSSGTRTLASAVFVFTRLIWIGLIIYTAAYATAQMTGWNLPAIALIIGITTICYTTMGGVGAVIWADFVQFILLFGGAIFIPLYVAFRTGAGPLTWWETFGQAGRAEVPIFSFDPTVRTTLVGMILLSFLWNLCTHGADQVAAQRYLTTSSPRAAQRSVWVFSILNVALSALLMFCGVSLFFFYFKTSSLPLQEFQSQIASVADSILPKFIATELPTGLSGLLLAALLAAAMSSLSSGMNSISTVLLNDFWIPFRTQRNPARELKLARHFSSVAGLGGIASALLVNELMRSSPWNLLDLMERVNHLFVAPLGALFLSGIFFRRTAAKAAVIGFCAGFLTSVLVSFSREIFGMNQGISFMWIMPASFVVSLTVSYLCGFLFPPPSEKQVAGMLLNPPALLRTGPPSVPAECRIDSPAT